MMSGYPTAQSHKPSNEVPMHDQSPNTSKPHGRRGEICKGVHIYDGDIDAYLRTFLSSQTPYTANINPDVAQMSSAFTAVKGKERESYKPLHKLLTALVAEFPAEKRPSFYVNCGQPLPFSFKDFAHRNHASKPDLAVSWPGVALPVSSADDKIDAPHCRMFSMAIEVKDVREKDPFLANADGSNHMSDSRANNLVQISVNARNLIFAHGLLAAFTLGIYGDVARIVRYDHACAIASPPMNITTIEGVRALQEFFWRFVHPWEGGPGSVVGADPTVRHLTAQDKTWLQARLNAHRAQMLRLSPRVRLDEARWVKVWDEDRPEPRAYVSLRLLNANSQLFSRSTAVWLAIEDTRLEACARNKPECESPAATGTGMQDPSEQQGPLVLRIIKEAWRQLARPSEKAYYDRMDATLTQPADRIGLPALVGGCDMGVRDVKRWRAAMNGEAWVGDDDLLSMQSTTTSDPEAAPETDLPQPSTGPPVIDKGYIPESVPIPMHQTHSWRLTGGAALKFKAKERSHMRMVVDTVGRPLDDFDSTKELVMAMYDAIRAHQTLTERCGILHRDVSSGNILIVEHQPEERTESAPCNGILHDFDHSSMLEEPPLADGSSTATAFESDQPPLLYTGEDLEVGDEEAVSVADLKERTGTYYFMAIDLLDPEDRAAFHLVHHDMESHIWVLLWIVLRHTAHGHHKGTAACASLFRCGDDDVDASGMKRNWLMKRFKRPLLIKANEPLTELLKALHKLMYDAIVSEKYHLTHAMVLAAFKAAIERDDWPTNDRALKFIPPKTTHVNYAQTDSTVASIQGSLPAAPPPHQTEAPERKDKRARANFAEDTSIAEESELGQQQLIAHPSEGTFTTGPRPRKRQRHSVEKTAAQTSSVDEGSSPGRQAA